MNSITDAEIIIVGGGAIGCGVAYALAQAGKTDILFVRSLSPDRFTESTYMWAEAIRQARLLYETYYRV
jgi:glycine/D-amino acid oxidase-like deaminating enzyme